MPQLSLYLNENILKKLEIASKIEHLSISKFVVKKFSESLNSSWPSNYDELFGSISDETFKVDKTMSFKNDSKREEL